MNDNTRNSPYELGGTAFDQVVERSSRAFQHEKERHFKTNEAEIVRLKHRHGRLDERQKELRQFLQQFPEGDPSTLRWKWWRNVIVAALLMIGGVIFVQMSLQPFGLGWVAWVFALALGIIAAMMTEQVLEHYDDGRLHKAVCIIAFVAALSGGVLLGTVRGEILSLQIQNAVEESGSAYGDSESRAADFYRTNTRWLSLSLALLTIAMELGAGLLIHDLKRFDLTLYKRAQEAWKELSALQDEIESIVGQIRYRENEPEVVEAASKRDFQLGVLDKLNKGGGLIPALLIATLLLLPSRSTAEAYSTTAVIAIDFSLSVSGRGRDGTTEFAKNVAAACTVVRTLPPGTRVTVIGITDHSFGEPYILLSRAIPKENGNLSLFDRITAARAHAASEVCQLGEKLKPTFHNSDIIGAAFLAADILKQFKDTRKLLIVFSDMRQATPEFDLEKPDQVAPNTALARAGTKRLIPDLTGVEVWALGVHGTGKSFGYWQDLRQFWAAYFTRSGAKLQAYSPNRQAVIR